MIILGIESSCDETSVALVEDGRRVLSVCTASQTDTHKLYGGVVPEIASRAHVEALVPLAREALSEAGVGWDGVGGVAVTYAPGLIGALLTGVSFAKGLALSLGLPLIPVHHLRAHIAALYLAHSELSPPHLSLVASGGHTHLALVRDYTDFAVLGRTRDDAAGEVLDKVGRIMGLGYPGGIALDRLAKDGDCNAYAFPSAQVEGSPLDFTFSGLKTAAINFIHRSELKQDGTFVPTDMAASFLRAVTGELISRLMLAAETTGCRTLTLSGGVAANSMLRQRLSETCEKRGYALYLPPPSLCGDNAAMVAVQGYYEFVNGYAASLDLNGYASMDMAVNTVNI